MWYINLPACGMMLFLSMSAGMLAKAVGTAFPTGISVAHIQIQVEFTCDDVVYHLSPSTCVCHCNFVVPGGFLCQVVGRFPVRLSGD